MRLLIYKLLFISQLTDCLHDPSNELINLERALHFVCPVSLSLSAIEGFLYARNIREMACELRAFSAVVSYQYFTRSKLRSTGNKQRREKHPILIRDGPSAYGLDDVEMEDGAYILMHGAGRGGSRRGSQ